MTRRRPQWAPVAFLGLALAMVTLTYGTAVRPLACSAGPNDWGEPCLPLHPSACYMGTSARAIEPVPNLLERRAVLEPDAPAAVELMCFYAEGGDGYVEIEWETASELETLGFHLLRSQNPEGPFEDISGFVPHCDDGGLVGGLYLFDDQSVANGVAYYYRLKEIVSDQHYVYYPPQNEPPLLAVPNVPTLTPTEQIPPSPTFTPRPTSTPTPTATETPAPTLTPRPTSTPAPPGSPQATQTPSPTVIARTFTPTPPPPGGAAGDVTPTQLASSPVPSATPVETKTMPLTLTPEVVALVVTAALESPLATPPTEPSLTAYPLGTFPAPTRTPFPSDYVSPPTRHSANQIATMTPTGSNRPGDVSEDFGDGPSPRFWLYVGFIGSLLLLLLGLLLMARQGERGDSASSVTEYPEDPDLGDDRDP